MDCAIIAPIMAKYDQVPSGAPRDEARIYDNARPLPDWFVEPGIDAERKPWGHTPFRPYVDGVREQQLASMGALSDLITGCDDALFDDHVKDVVLRDMLAGMSHRETKLDANFSHWERQHPDERAIFDTDEALKWQLGEGLDGHGTVDGLLSVLNSAPSLRSLDLQVLSTPFGYRGQYLPKMEAELAAGLSKLDADIHDQPIPVGRVYVANHWSEKNHNDDVQQNAQILVRKQEVATIPDASPRSISELIHIVRRESWLALPAERGSDLEAVLTNRIHRQIGVVALSTMILAYRDMPKPSPIAQINGYNPKISDIIMEARAGYSQAVVVDHVR